MENSLNYNIVTNNPKVVEKYENIIFVEGSYRDVLLKVRDLTHKGYELINHPLGASIRMFFSPYRSIIIGNKAEGNNDFHINIIESSIESYDKQMALRDPDVVNSDDYSFIDDELLDSALKEFQRLKGK